MRATPAALIGAMSVAFASAASAGGPDSWEGFYAGVNIGYAWGSSDAVTSTDCGTFVPFYFDCGNQPGVQASGTGSLSPRGVTGGVQAGYNWQEQAWVYGGALDFGSFNLSKSRTGASTYASRRPACPMRRAPRSTPTGCSRRGGDWDGPPCPTCCSTRRAASR